MASHAKERGIIPSGVLDDASVDIAGSPSGCSLVPSSRLVLLEGFAKMSQAYAFFLEFSLQLVELFEVRLLNSYWGGCDSPCLTMVSGVCIERGSCIPALSWTRVALGSHSSPTSLELEALPGWIVIVPVRV